MKRHLTTSFLFFLSLNFFSSNAMKRHSEKLDNKNKSSHQTKRSKTENDEQDLKNSSQQITAFIEQLVNIFPESSPGFNNHFLHCLKSGNQDMMLSILNNCPLISGRSTIGKALLRCGLINDYYDIVKLLVTRGIDLKHPKLIETLLFEAIIKGHEDIVQNLLTYHDIPVDCLDCFGHNPLIKAIGCGRKNIVRMLLNYSLVRLEIKRNMMGQALIWAFTNKHTQIIKKLLHFYKQC